MLALSIHNKSTCIIYIYFLVIFFLIGLRPLAFLLRFYAAQAGVASQEKQSGFLSPCEARLHI
jgi:hypothetical protein